MMPERQATSVRPPTLPAGSATEPALGASLRLAVASTLSVAADRPPQVVVGIRVKLVALMVGTSFLIVGILASYFPAQQIAEMRVGGRERAVMYGRLASLQLRPAVAFSDQQTAREVLNAIAKDTSVVGIAVYADNGSRLAAEGNLSELADAARHGFDELRTFYLPGRVLVTAPVQSLEGPKGTFVLELSTRSAIAARARLIRAALGVGAGALAFGSLLAWAIARSLASRVENIAHAAAAVAQGDLEQRLTLSGPQDEIGVLVFGFNAMISRLRDLIQQVHDAAREENQRLESLVRERTKELDRRNGDLRLVLDNVEQGFVTIDREATVVGERSRVVDEWLGPLTASDRLWRRLDAASPGCGAVYDLAWAQLIEDIMPAEVSLAQLPEQLRVSDRHLRFEYKLLGPSDSFDRLLVVISDITAIVAQKRSEQEVQDILEVSAKVLNDRSGFLEFFEDTHELLGRVVRGNADPLLLKRDLHTLKGNSALYGMSLVSQLCHEAESQLEISLDGGVDCSGIAAQWNRTYAQVQPLIEDGGARGIAIDERDYLALLAALRTGTNRGAVTRMVEAWRLEQVRTRLERAAQQLSATVSRLGKGDIQVIVDSTRLFMAQGELSEFWSVFSHVLRNAAAHGLEAPDERTRLGKVGLPRFALRAGVHEDRLFVELQDPGPGVDWDALRARAMELGLPASSRAALVEALFTDGLSTETAASELAGRGVGLSAVRAACARRGGDVAIHSERGHGSTFRFSWPVATFKTLVRFDLDGLS